MRRCTIIIPDAGPFNSLWMADRLELLLALDMRIVVIDAVYDDMTVDLSYPRDRAVKRFIDGNRPPFVVERTDIGVQEREKRKRGDPLKKNAGDVAVVDFMTSEEGLGRYVGTGEPVLMVFEDAGVRAFKKPPNLHLISTVGLLRGLERVGVIASANDVIHQMTHPAKMDRRPVERVTPPETQDGAEHATDTEDRWQPLWT